MANNEDPTAEWDYAGLLYYIRPGAAEPGSPRFESSKILLQTKLALGLMRTLRDFTDSTNRLSGRLVWLNWLLVLLTAFLAAVGGVQLLSFLRN